MTNIAITSGEPGVDCSFFPTIEDFINYYSLIREGFNQYEPINNGARGLEYIPTRYANDKRFIPLNFFPEEALYLACVDDSLPSLAIFIMRVYEMDKGNDPSFLFPRQMERLLASIQVNDGVYRTLLRKIYPLYYNSSSSFPFFLEDRIYKNINAYINFSINRINFLKMFDETAAACPD